MPDEKPYKYENLPIPSYEEATSSRASTPNARPGGEERGNDEERRGLLPPDATRPPPTEAADSQRDSLDALELLAPEAQRGSGDDDDEAVRREIQELDMEEPPAEQSRWGKRISSISQSLQLPFKIRWPTTWRFRMPKLEISIFMLLARMFAVLLVVGLGYLVFVSDIFSSAAQRMGSAMYDPERVRMWMQEQIDPGNIRSNLQHLTSFDHVAGTAGDYALTKWVHKAFIDADLDDVVKDQYDVYLNYPKESGRAVELLESDGSVSWKAKLEEELVYPEEGRKQVPVFHGHSKSGVVQGPLIYANFGSREDFQHLIDSGITTRGGIALVRYYGTQGDRALKVKAAELAGFAGCIIYNDPALDGFVQGDVWPDGRYVPADGVQRGSVSLMSWVVGDVLTPGWASVDGAERLPPANSTGLNKIPSIPLAWRDAQTLLQAVKGHGKPAPAKWVGGVPDIVDWWTGDQSSPVVVLKNEQDEVERQPIWNVMGKIKGTEQAAKSIIIGNHRDAWAFGAADPGSGTAVLVELVRVFGELKRHGWRPMRTIEFASWDGEEYNLVGSTEYVENNIKKLREDAFAYINVDVAVLGQTFRASASPVFRESLLRVLSRVSDPLYNASLKELWEQTDSKLGGLGAGSDYVAFQDIAGVSSIDFGFMGKAYPYHSVYDCFEWMDRFGDPGFQYHQLLGQVWALLVLEMADRPVLPFSMGAYAAALHSYVDDLDAWAQAKRGDAAWDVTPLRRAAAELDSYAANFDAFEPAWEALVRGNGGFESSSMGSHRMGHNMLAGSFDTLLLDLEEGGGVSRLLNAISDAIDRLTDNL